MGRRTALYAERDQESGQVTIRLPISRKVVVFKSVCAGVAWGNPKEKKPEFHHHALVVGGQRADEDTIHVFQEATFGRLSDLAEHMVNLKDELFCDRFWIPGAPEGHINFLYDWDGLTRYQHLGRSPTGIIKWRHSTDHWPAFRSREAIASLYTYDPILSEDFEAASDLVNLLARDEKVGISMAHMSRLRAAREDIHDLKNYPIFQSYIGLVYELHSLREGQMQPVPAKPDHWPWDPLEAG